MSQEPRPLDQVLVPAAAPSAAPPLLVSAAEAARLLGVSPRWLWTATNSGEIPHVRLGRSVRYRLETLTAWIAERERRGARR